MRNQKKPSLFQIETLSSGRLPFSQTSLRLFCRKILSALELGRAHLSLLFVRDPEMKRWHWKWMGLRSTTDVISLAQKEGEPDPLGSLGDLIICLDEAKRQAKRAGCSCSEELGRYIVHGILHCLGYDDIRPRDRRKMWAVQEQLVGKYKKLLR